MEAKVFYDKVYACWLGKNIGGTLGEPVEGKMEKLHLTFYPKLAENGSLPNDDLDLQLVNLHALEEYGVHITSEHLGREWREHIFFPYDEYGYAATNLRRGFIPPFSGVFNNPFTNCMGSPIRSELWAAVAMGRPEVAAYYAFQDAVVDHAGGEGVYGEIFFAVLESLAYESDDKIHLIEQALSYLPVTSRVFQSVSDTLKWYQDGVTYDEIRSLLITHHGRSNFTDAPINLAFTMVGFLYGSDFEDGILKAVNLGYDTDCTAATLGALYGILYGTSFIPEKWSSPIGTAIAVSPPVRGFDAPADLDELTRRTLKIAQKLSMEEGESFQFTIPNDYAYQRFFIPPESRCRNLAFTLRYDGEPAIVPGGTLQVNFEIENNTTGKWTLNLRLSCPDGISCEQTCSLEIQPNQTQEVSFLLRGGQQIANINTLVLQVERVNNGSSWTVYQLPFSVLRARCWNINGVQKFTGGDLIPFEQTQSGCYEATCKIVVPFTRTVQLCAAAELAPVQLSVDGKQVIDCREKLAFMPAFHRTPPEQIAKVLLSKGGHQISLSMQTDGVPRVMFYMVESGNPVEPGSYYYYNEIEIIESEGADMP